MSESEPDPETEPAQPGSSEHRAEPEPLILGWVHVRSITRHTGDSNTSGLVLPDVRLVPE